MNKNIKDVTNSPKDWEDFWYSPEKYGDWGHPESEQSIPDPESEQQNILSQSINNILNLLDKNYGGDYNER